jgi:hypothetical protein
MSRTQPSDDYEKQMAVAGKVLHRDKMVSRPIALLAAIMTSFFGIVSVLYWTGWGNMSLLQKLLAPALTALSVWVGLTKTSVRTVVTDREILVQHGLRGPRIPVSAVTKCEVWPQGKRAEGGTEIYAPSVKTMVYLEWMGGEGKPRKALVGVTDPRAFVEAVNGAAGKRIEAAPEEAEEENVDETEEEERARG